MCRQIQVFWTRIQVGGWVGWAQGRQLSNVLYHITFFYELQGTSGWLIGLGNRDECLVLFLFFDYFLSLCLKYGFSDLYSLPLRKIPWFLGPFHAHTCGYSFSHITIY